MNMKFSTCSRPSLAIVLLGCGLILVSLTGTTEAKAPFSLSKIPAGVMPQMKKFFANSEETFACMEKKGKITPDVSQKYQAVLGKYDLHAKGPSMSDADWKTVLKEMEKSPEVNEVFEGMVAKIIDFLQCVKELKA